MEKITGKLSLLTISMLLMTVNSIFKCKTTMNTLFIYVNFKQWMKLKRNLRNKWPNYTSNSNMNTIIIKMNFWRVSKNTNIISNFLEECMKNTINVRIYLEIASLNSLLIQKLMIVMNKLLAKLTKLLRFLSKLKKKSQILQNSWNLQENMSIKMLYLERHSISIKNIKNSWTLIIWISLRLLTNITGISFFLELQLNHTKYIKVLPHKMILT